MAVIMGSVPSGPAHLAQHTWSTPSGGAAAQDEVLPGAFYAHSATGTYSTRSNRVEPRYKKQALLLGGRHQRQAETPRGLSGGNGRTERPGERGIPIVLKAQ